MYTISTDNGYHLHSIIMVVIMAVDSRKTNVVNILLGEIK